MARPIKPQRYYGIQIHNLQWMLRLTEVDNRLKPEEATRLNSLTTEIMRLLLDIQERPITGAITVAK